MLGHPFTALALSAGGLWVLYLTPLHGAALHDPLLGLLVQTHVVLAGTLYNWAIVGADHVPRRPSARVRGAALLAGLVLHTVLSRLLFADAGRLAEEAGGTAAQWRSAAEIMWFEGDLVELALLTIFVVEVARRRARRPGAAPAAVGGLGLGAVTRR